MDFLGYFAFRTAFPFGYLIFAAGGLVAFSVGLYLVVTARPADRSRVIGGGGMVAMVLFFVAANLLYGAAIELNPTFTRADMIGTWREDESQLSLHGDGTYRCQGDSQCNLMGSEGRWRLEGGSLTFERADGSLASQRVVRYFDALRFANPIEDPDSWDGRLTFVRIDSSGR
jgi:hypothetical protein